MNGSRCICNRSLRIVVPNVSRFKIVPFFSHFSRTVSLLLRPRSDIEITSVRHTLDQNDLTF